MLQVQIWCMTPLHQGGSELVQMVHPPKGGCYQKLHQNSEAERASGASGAGAPKGAAPTAPTARRAKRWRELERIHAPSS